MLRSLKVWAHVIVGLSVLMVGLLALVGIVGESSKPEKIEQLQVVVSGVGDNGVRITETIDQDFGTSSRHGPQLVVPNDFGAPTDVTASSSDAPDAVDVSSSFDLGVAGTRIRVGDAGTTISGQHRYVISYVLPAARFAEPTFALDAVGADSAIPIEHVTVVFSGISLDSPTCTKGSSGSTTPCAFERGAPLRLGVARLAPHQGITVRGEVTRWTAGEPVKAPALPDRRSSNHVVTALWVMALGAAAAVAVYVLSVRKGANEVVGTGAGDAAHGVTGPGGLTPHKVSDAELADMATIEFAPPKGIEPWQGAVVLTEELNASSVTSWFSGAIASGLLDIEVHDGHPRLSRGPNAGAADTATSHVLDKMFGNRHVVDLDGYDAKFSSAWTEVERLQDTWVASSGWWSSKPPRRGMGKPGGCITSAILVVGLIAAVILAVVLLAVLGSVGGIVTGVVIGVALPTLVARVAYAPLRPARTANGSAYALQTESFRRFLVESEAQYVEWAWKNGLLRQYSAWAVALDAAAAWRQAMERAGVPQPEIQASSTPLLVHSMSNSFASSHTQPAQSSGGSSGSSFSSGGFSSGSVGGGGGGGSHGSW